MDTTSLSIAYSCCALVSLVCSSAVLFVGVVDYRTVLLTWTRPFTHIIVCISVSDVFASAFMVIGYARNGTMSCSAQGWAFLYFYPATWIWTTLLVFQIRGFLLQKSLNLSPGVAHSIGWGLPLLASLLPLSTNHYGQDDQLESIAPCELGGDAVTKGLWIVGANSGLAAVCFALMLFWVVQAVKKMNDRTSANNVELMALLNKQRNLLHALQLYPLALFITWIPVFIGQTAGVCGVRQNTGSLINIYSIQVTTMLQTQYGTLLAIVFFWNSRSARNTLLNKIPLCRSCFSSSKNRIRSTDSRITIANNLNVFERESGMHSSTITLLANDEAETDAISDEKFIMEYFLGGGHVENNTISALHPI